MTNLDRAAALIHDGRFYSDCGHQCAEDLARAGLLVTDEIQAVLDAATHRNEVMQRDYGVIPDGPRFEAFVRDLADSTARYHEVFDAYLASRGAS